MKTYFPSIVLLILAVLLAANSLAESSPEFSTRASTLLPGGSGTKRNDSTPAPPVQGGAQTGTTVYTNASANSPSLDTWDDRLSKPATTRVSEHSRTNKDNSTLSIQKQRERLDALSAQLNELLTKYTEKDGTIQAIRKQIADHQKQLAKNSAANDKQMLSIRKQREQLDALSAQLNELLTKYTEKDRRVRATRTQIADLQKQLARSSAANDKQLLAIQKQREQFDALSAQLNELLTKYAEKDGTVRAIRKQIADLQGQLAKNSVATVPAANSETNRTKASNASANVANVPTRSTNAWAKATSASASVTNALGKATDAMAKAAVAKTNTALANSTNAPAKGTSPTTTSTNAFAKSTNAPAADKQLRAIQKQRERLDALSAQLNELLTKYTENDRRVRATRKQIADIQKELAKNPSATVPFSGSGTNRTAMAINASGKVTNVTNAPTRSTNALATNTNAPAHSATKSTDAIANASNARAKTTNASEKANALANAINAPAEAAYATGKGGNASGYGTNITAKRTTAPAAAMSTNSLAAPADGPAKAIPASTKATDASPAKVTNDAAAKATNAMAQASTAFAKGTNTLARATDAPARGTNAPTKAINALAKATNAPMARASDALASVTNASPAHATNALAKSTDTSANHTNTPPNTSTSVNLVTMETLDDKHRLAIGDRLSFRLEEDRYRLAPGDKLSVRSEEEPTPLLVTDSGELEVPYIGRFPAENKTCKQLAHELKAALEKDYFYQATVILAVDLKTKSRGRVYLNGAVHVPGPQEIPSDEVLTLGKAILRAGGFTDFAERHNVKVTRKVGTGESENKTLIVDIAQVFDKGKMERDLPLQPGDLILVSERLIRF